MHRSHQIFKIWSPLAWGTERSCHWSVLRPPVSRVQLDRSWRGSGQRAPPGRVTEALISQGKALSSEPIFRTRVDPVQEEVFLGPVPTLVVTAR